MTIEGMFYTLIGALLQLGIVLLFAPLVQGIIKKGVPKTTELSDSSNV